METLIENDQNEYVNSEIIEREMIDNTPFTCVTTDIGSSVALGRFRLTELQDKGKCHDMVLERDWGLIMSLITVILNTLKDDK